MTEKNVINFPKDKIVRKQNNLEITKPEKVHLKRIEKILWELKYEFLKGFEANELDSNTEFHYCQVLPIQRQDKHDELAKFTKLELRIYPTHNLT